MPPPLEAEAPKVVPEAFDLAELVVPTAGRIGPTVVVPQATPTRWRPTRVSSIGAPVARVVVVVKVRVRIVGMDHVVVVDHYADGAAAGVLLLARILESRKIGEWRIRLIKGGW